MTRRDTIDLIRSVGGVMLAAGASVAFVRKSAHGDWGELAQLLVVATPAVALYLMALEPLDRSADRRENWPGRSALLVASVLLALVALFQLLDWLKANTSDQLWPAAVFAVIALLNGYAAVRARIAYGALLAGLSLLAAWLLVWAKILDDPSANSYRWLSVIAAVLLFLAAAAQTRVGSIGARELATAGGVAAVAAGALGVVVGLVAGTVGPLLALGSKSPGHALAAHGGSFGAFSRHVSGLQHFGWDVYLLCASLALVWIGARTRTRGTGYVGGIGLLTFVLSVSIQVTRIESGHEPTGDVLGWPLTLVLLGLVGLAASFAYRPEQRTPAQVSSGVEPE